MVMTSLEAHVDPNKQELLKQAFKQQLASQLPGAIEAVLTQSSKDPTLWRLNGFWKSHEDFENYRRSVEVPAGFLIFRAAGAEPTIAMFEVVDQQKWS
jgi:heme-degrading monooxygenase HmoA